jgi:putative transposase
MYLHWLGEALTDSGCRLHAYVLMTNHVHLLLTPPDPNAVSRLMISLGSRYVQHVNRRYRRTGTLWASRYKSSLVEAESYLLLCQRYIELNPVRAAMVDDPVHYRWSRYRANGLGQVDFLLTPHPLYLDLGREEAVRFAAYRALFRPELDGEAIDDIRLALDQGQPLGGLRFIQAIENAPGSEGKCDLEGGRANRRETAPTLGVSLVWISGPAPFLSCLRGGHPGC